MGTRSNPAINSFIHGEITPRLYGRSDLEIYFKSCRLLQNFIVQPQGPVTRRPGTKYIAPVKAHSEAVRLVGYEQSAGTAYMLEFGNQYLRLYKDGGQVMDGGSPYEIATPYGTDDLAGIKFDWIADTIYLVHPDYAPRKLVRSGDTSWALTAVDFAGGPFLDQNKDETLTVTPSAATGTGITLTASSGLFVSGHVGALWRIAAAGGAFGYCKITAVASATSATADVIEDLPSTSATWYWSEGAWSDYRGYPGAVRFYEQRLLMAGSDHRPLTVWGSVVDDYENHAAGAGDDADAYIYTLAGARQNRIRWICDSAVAHAGTDGGEWKFGFADLPTTPSNVDAKRETPYGTADIQAQMVGDVVMFVQAGGTRLRAINYEFAKDKYRAPDISFKAEHLLQPGIVAMAPAMLPDPVVWLVRSDGVLVGASYDPDAELISYHRHQIADGIVESADKIRVGTRDEVWLAVRRTIDGSTVRYIEQLQADTWSAKEDAWYLDCALAYDGAATSVLSGLDHLEGETVGVWADGGVHPAKVVSSGDVTLDYPVEKAIVGKVYTSIVNPQLVQPPIASGSSLGKPADVVKVTVRLYNTLGLKVGYDLDHLDVVPFRTTATPLGSPPDLFTGDKPETPLPPNPDQTGSLYLVCDTPAPATIQALAMTAQASDL